MDTLSSCPQSPSPLDKWMNLTSNSVDCERIISFEDLTRLRTGPDIDKAVGWQISPDHTVSVKLKEGSDPSLPVWTCLAHIEDVPSDGDCGFHALRLASLPFGGKTALGGNMPVSASATRQALIAFLQEKRIDIEKEIVTALGARRAAIYLWRDLNCSPETLIAEGVLFDEFCERLGNSGLTGHWLGACLGDFELHLLGRCLGVNVHCVSSCTSSAESLPMLRQVLHPNSSLWSGSLQGTPKGAVVIRFTGNYSGGHYQIIKCGRKSATLTQNQYDQTTSIEKTRYLRLHSLLHPPPPLVNEKRNAQRKPSKDRAELSQHVSAIYRMHGVQEATKKRYSKNYNLVEEEFSAMREKGRDPLDLEKNGAFVVECIMGMLLQRCGPTEKGYDGKSASATGNVLLAAVGMWYKNQGVSFTNNHTCVVRGNSVSGPPWKAQQLSEFKSSIEKAQAKGRSNPVKRAYQLTHDDVASAMRKWVANQLGDALDAQFQPGTNPAVNWMMLQTTLMVTASFGSGARGAEMVNLRLGDLVFLSENIETTVGATLYGVKAKTGSEAVRRIIFPSWTDTLIISPAFAILTHLSLIHGIYGGDMSNANSPLFPVVHRNQFQKGLSMSSDTYSAAVGALFADLGIADNATEHSPRRGGAGFRYFVLKEDPYYIRDFLGHRDIAETLTYIGFHDKKNSNVSQGYGTCAARPIR